MKLFRFLAYTFAFFIGVVFAFRGTNSFPGNPAKQYKPTYLVKKTVVADEVKKPVMNAQLQLGKSLFVANCASCHNRNMKDALIGPGLRGVEDRWAAFPKEDLYNWIRNSQALIDKDHPQAVTVWKEWKQLKMTNFPTLSDEDIKAILAYVEAV